MDPKYKVGIYSMFNRGECEMEIPILEPFGFEPIIIDEKKEEDLEVILGDIDALLMANNNLPARFLPMMTKCKIIARQGVGLDNIPVKEAEALGITVCNVPDCSTREVADHALALMVSMARNVVFYNNKVKQENIWDIESLPRMKTLAENVVFLVGFGKIGRLTAQRISPVFDRVLVFDPFADKKIAEELGVTLVDSLEAGLREADIVSLHFPLNPETYHVINKDTLAMMKPTAYLLNLSRGPHVDRDDLEDALNNGVIAGAALDVIEYELDVEKGDFSHPLFQNPKVVFTPHVGWYSQGSYRKARVDAAEQIVALMEGRPLPGRANNPQEPRQF